MSGAEIPARTLIPGAAEGPLLRLTAPISFWGGVDPHTGRIQNPRHPQCGEIIGGRALAIPRLIGSSSASAILLELIHGGRAPAALILGGVDAVLLVGCLVGRALELLVPPAVELAPEAIAALPEGRLQVCAGDAGPASITPLGGSGDAPR